MAVSRRQAQLAAALQRVAAEAILHASPSQLLTVTRATISPDARQASLYVAGWAALDEPEQRRVLQEIIERVTASSQTKFTPRLSIVNDDTAEYAAHVSSLI